MLVHKQDSQVLKQAPSSVMSNPKLYRIPSSLTNSKEVHIPELPIPIRRRKGSLNLAEERTSSVGEDSFIARAPKIYTKNLPDVFIINTPHSRRSSKVVVKPLERFRNSSDEPELKKELVPIKIQRDAGPRESKPFPSPLRLAQPRTSRNERRILSSFNSRNPTPTGTPSYLSSRGSKLESKNREHDISVPNIFHFNIKPTPPVNLSMVSYHEEKSSNIDSIHLSSKPLAENIDPNRRADKSFIIKKLFAKLPEPEFFDFSLDDQKPRPMRNRIVSATPTPQLHEIITLKKLRTTANNGIIKRTLHVPTFRILDVQEEPISSFGTNETLGLKDWLELWKINFQKDKYLAQVHSYFLNAPEGCLSILLEPSRNGFLGDFINNFGGLPEKHLQSLAKTLTKGLNHIHKKLQRLHGNLGPYQVIITDKGSFKLTPGLKAPETSILNSYRGNSVRNYKSGEILVGLADVKPQAPTDISFKNYSQDMFDLGFLLLQCALGDFNLYDPSAIFTLKNIKTVIENPGFKRSLKKNACCLLHYEAAVREAIGFMPGVQAPGLKGKVPLKEKNSTFSYIPLLELLQSGNHFSEGFTDFLCTCLRFDYTQRLDTQVLLAHDFLRENYRLQGPSVSINELMKIEIKDFETFDANPVQGLAENHLDKFIEGLKIVLLDKSIKLKFEAIVHLNYKTETTEKRIAELAEELGLPTLRLYDSLVKALH